MSDKEASSAPPTPESAPADSEAASAHADESTGSTQNHGDASPNASGANAPTKTESADAKETESAKPKRTMPYVNPNRFKTGGAEREKLTPEELTERMQSIRLKNEKIKERRVTVQADEQAFKASQAAQRAKEAVSRKVQTGIDASRAANARRKMEKPKTGYPPEMQHQSRRRKLLQSPHWDRVMEAAKAVCEGVELVEDAEQKEGVDRKEGVAEDEAREAATSGEKRRRTRKCEHKRRRIHKSKGAIGVQLQMNGGTGADEWGTTGISVVGIANEKLDSGAVAVTDDWGIVAETPAVDSGQNS